MYQLIASLPPYDSMPPQKDAFDEMREKYEWIINMSSDGKSNDCVPLDEIDEAEDMDRVLQFDAGLKALIAEHQTFLEDLLRVQQVFAPFLERVHHRSEFLSNEETAAVLDAFMRDTDKLIHSYDKLKPSGTMTMTYQVLHDNDHPVLCEQYHFTTIGAFLYVELFKGLQNHYLPKRCGYCGRYFLLESAYYSDYCTREVEDMNGKRCRDLGHRKKYADKIKNDPVWLTYSRAYKAHYARFLKKKRRSSRSGQTMRSISGSRHLTVRSNSKRTWKKYENETQRVRELSRLRSKKHDRVKLFFRKLSCACRQGRRLCPRNGTQVKCSCFDQPKRLVKTDIGWRLSIGALFERFHAIFTSVFAAVADIRMILLTFFETLFENTADEP